MRFLFVDPRETSRWANVTRRHGWHSEISSFSGRLLVDITQGDYYDRGTRRSRSSGSVQHAFKHRSYERGTWVVLDCRL
jgi:hypothetical protein